MGYPVQPNAPTMIVGGRAIAIGAFRHDAPDGTDYMFGIYEQINGGWNLMDNTYSYGNANDLLNDMKAKGGSVQFLAWLVTKLNASLKKLFGVLVPPTQEPVNDEEVLAFIQSSLSKMQFTVVNGIPTLS